MTVEKIDAALRAEMQRLEKAGHGDRRLVVVIEFAATADASPAGSDVAGMTAGSRALQQRLIRRLTEVGAVDVQEMLLANALVGKLTPEQIRTLAADDDVKRIFWNVAEKVTL